MYVIYDEHIPNRRIFQQIVKTIILYRNIQYHLSLLRLEHQIKKLWHNMKLIMN